MKRINNILIILTWLISIISIILKFTINYQVNILVCIVISLIMILPKILRTKIKITNRLEFIILLFIFLAGTVGSILRVYDLIYWYDSFTHLISGILTAFLGIVILNKTKKRDKKELWNIFFIIIFTLAVAASWEIFEFTADNLLNGNAQRIETGVTDTMKDIICALLGNILFIIIYVYKKPKLENI